MAGTLIETPNGKKKIEDIKVGDKVLSVNEKTLEVEEDEVSEFGSYTKDKIVKISFDSNVENKNTFDHPYFVKGKGWASYSPDETEVKYGFGVEQLEEGDSCYLYVDGELKETGIVNFVEENVGSIQTYNLDKVKKNHNFLANGILVHNKRMKPNFGSGKGLINPQGDAGTPKVGQRGTLEPQGKGSFNLMEMLVKIAAMGVAGDPAVVSKGGRKESGEQKDINRRLNVALERQRSGTGADEQVVNPVTGEKQLRANAQEQISTKGAAAETAEAGGTAVLEGLMQEFLDMEKQSREEKQKKEEAIKEEVNKAMEVSGTINTNVNFGTINGKLEVLNKDEAIADIQKQTEDLWREASKNGWDVGNKIPNKLGSGGAAAAGQGIN